VSPIPVCNETQTISYVLHIDITYNPWITCVRTGANLGHQHVMSSSQLSF
jgi:hypothetical protein